VLGVVLQIVREGSFKKKKNGEQGKAGGAQIVAGRTAPKKRRPTPAPKAIKLAALRKYKVGELKCKLRGIKTFHNRGEAGVIQPFNRLAGHLKLG
jgi:hypothetical protein